MFIFKLRSTFIIESMLKKLTTHNKVSWNRFTSIKRFAILHIIVKWCIKDCVLHL